MKKIVLAAVLLGIATTGAMASGHKSKPSETRLAKHTNGVGFSFFTDLIKGHI